MQGRIGWTLLSGLLVVGLSSCSTMKGWVGWDGEKEAAQTAETPTAVAGTEDYKAELDKTVRRFIEAATRKEDADRQRVAGRKPHFYKEYVQYPGGPGGFDVAIRETESRSAPYVADVTIEKLRFATRLHPSREAAHTDARFLRNTGTETLTYEYRNGRWTRVGSLFVADKTEENINGEWVPCQETVEQALATEEPKGWFGRQWSRFTGRGR